MCTSWCDATFQIKIALECLGSDKAGKFVKLMTYLSEENS